MRRKKSMVVQGIKDRSEIRGTIVTRKWGCGDECETGEETQGSTRRWVSMGEWGDPGEICYVACVIRSLAAHTQV